MILADGLGKDFREGFLRRRKPALGAISFEIRQGECVGFLGPNGAGKSTTIHLLMGFLQPTRGRVLLDGRSPRDAASRVRVGFLPEVFAFDRFATVRTLLARFDAMSGGDSGSRQHRIESAIATVELSEALGRRIGALSKGMTQRVGLAQAILGDPELLILDEPMSGMDPASRHLVKKLLAGRHDRGHTTLFSSHILADVEEVVDRALVLVRGTLRADVSVAELTRGRAGTVIRFTDPNPERFDPFLAERGIARGSEGDHGHVLTIDDTSRKNEVIAHLAASGADVISVAPSQATLEQAFLALTESAGEAR